MLVAVVERTVRVAAAAEPKPKFIMQDVQPAVKLVEMKPPHPRQVDDDWFVLLDVAARAPGILLCHVWPLMYDGIRQNKCQVDLSCD